MLIEDPDFFTLTEYHQRHRGFHVHHTRPTSRDGRDTHFNFFPWRPPPHAAWHDIFINLYLKEIWGILPQAHREIFMTADAFVRLTWARSCHLMNKEQFLNHKKSVQKLRKSWNLCFLSDNLEDAQWFLKFMLLYVIFGENMRYPHEIFKPEGIRHFLQRYPLGNRDRLWAFQCCFGETPRQSQFKEYEKAFWTIMKHGAKVYRVHKRLR